MHAQGFDTLSTIALVGCGLYCVTKEAVYVHANLKMHQPSSRAAYRKDGLKDVFRIIRLVILLPKYTSLGTNTPLVLNQIHSSYSIACTYMRTLPATAKTQKLTQLSVGSSLPNNVQINYIA